MTQVLSSFLQGKPNLFPEHGPLFYSFDSSLNSLAATYFQVNFVPNLHETVRLHVPMIDRIEALIASPPSGLISEKRSALICSFACVSGKLSTVRTGIEQSVWFTRILKRIMLMRLWLKRPAHARTYFASATRLEPFLTFLWPGRTCSSDRIKFHHREDTILLHRYISL